jgi:nucleotide-binding universal stress UspA family protein
MVKDITIKKILIAVEDSVYSDKAVAYGFSLGKTLGAELALVHVNEIPLCSPYVTDQVLNEPVMIIPELMKIQDEASQRLFVRLIKTAESELKIKIFEKIGNPRDEIVSTADEWNADLIILGTHGRTGLDHFIVGSVAESIINKTKCPLLIIPGKE